MRPEWRSRPKRSALFYEGGEDFDDDDEDNKNISTPDYITLYEWNRFGRVICEING